MRHPATAADTPVDRAPRGARSRIEFLPPCTPLGLGSYPISASAAVLTSQPKTDLRRYYSNSPPMSRQSALCITARPFRNCREQSRGGRRALAPAGCAAAAAPALPRWRRQARGGPERHCACDFRECIDAVAPQRAIPCATPKRWCRSAPPGRHITLLLDLFNNRHPLRSRIRLIASSRTPRVIADAYYYMVM